MMRKSGIVRMSVVLAFLALVAAPYAAYGNPLAARALAIASERLTEQVMKAVQPKIADMVAKAPVSQEAKAEIEKKLTESARAIVKRQIDGAMGGKLPNPVQLANEVVNELGKLAADLIRSSAQSVVVGAVASPGAPAAVQAPAPVSRPVGAPAADYSPPPVSQPAAASIAVVLEPSPPPPPVKPRLGIRPFTGGSDGDSETISILFTIQESLRSAFNVVTDDGAQEVDFTLSGHITDFEGRNLLVAAIVGTKTSRLMVGGYRLYGNVEEIPGAIPYLASEMVVAARRTGASRPRLVFAPLTFVGQEIGVETREILAQMIPIAIANTGMYSLRSPDSAYLRAALEEPDISVEDRAKALGAETGADCVLFAEIRTLGSMNMLIMQILRAADGVRIAGESLNFRALEEAVERLPQVAALLTANAPKRESPPPAPAAPPPPPPVTAPADIPRREPPPPAPVQVDLKRFMVSFNTNGGNPGVIQPIVVNGGEALGGRFPMSPTKPDHLFDGWFKSDWEEYTPATKITGDVTLVARWRHLPERAARRSVAQEPPETETTAGGGRTRAGLRVAWNLAYPTAPIRLYSSGSSRGYGGEVYTDDFGHGLELGLVTSTRISNLWSFNSGGYFIFRSPVNYDDYDFHMREAAVAVPAMFRFAWRHRGFAVFTETGVQFDFALSDISKRNVFDTGYKIGFGVYFGRHVELGLGRTWGLIDFVDVSEQRGKKISQESVALTIMFGGRN